LPVLVLIVMAQRWLGLEEPEAVTTEEADSA